MSGQIDDLLQVAAEEVAEREQLDRVVALPDADAVPDPLAELRELEAVGASAGDGER
jgi:hypothetical protein